MIAARPLALYAVAIAALVASHPVRVSAQWWNRAPADFEECSETAEKAATPQEKTTALAECSAKFAGRRKPGGGYTYYDFMQDRSFEIAGPNPTPEEQKRIDEQYTIYLENQRRSSIAAALAAKQQEQSQAEQVSLKSEAAPKVPLPRARPIEQQQAAATAATEIRPGLKRGDCARHRFSCEWPRLSEGINEIKKLFGSQPSKTKRADRS